MFVLSQASDYTSNMCLLGTVRFRGRNHWAGLCGSPEQWACHTVISWRVLPSRGGTPAIWLLKYLERNCNIWLTWLRTYDKTDSKRELVNQSSAGWEKDSLVPWPLPQGRGAFLLPLMLRRHTTCSSSAAAGDAVETSPCYLIWLFPFCGGTAEERPHTRCAAGHSIKNDSIHTPRGTHTPEQNRCG